MKLKLQAIEWAVGNGVTLDEFFNELTRWSLDQHGQPKEIQHDARERAMAVQQKGDFWVVLILTSRDHRKFFEMMREGGKLVMTARGVTDGAQAVDFNYLIVHRETGRGVYAHYQHSCHFDDLTRICRDVYSEWKAGLIAAESAADGGDEKAVRRAEVKYANKLKGTLLVTPQQVREIVETLRHIKTLELTFGEVQVKQPWGQPLQDVVTVAKHTFLFSRKIPIRSLRDKVVSAIDRSKTSKGRFVGETEDGVEHAYRLRKNAGTFQELDFDEVAHDLRFDFANLADSTVVRQMEKAIRERPAYFVKHKKPPKPKPPAGKQAKK